MNLCFVVTAAAAKAQPRAMGWRCWTCPSDLQAKLAVSDSDFSPGEREGWWKAGLSSGGGQKPFLGSQMSASPVGVLPSPHFQLWKQIGREFVLIFSGGISSSNKLEFLLAPESICAVAAASEAFWIPVCHNFCAIWPSYSLACSNVKASSS